MQLIYSLHWLASSKSIGICIEIRCLPQRQYKAGFTMYIICCLQYLITSIIEIQRGRPGICNNVRQTTRGSAQ